LGERIIFQGETKITFFNWIERSCLELDEAPKVHFPVIEKKHQALEDIIHLMIYSQKKSFS
jgi:hypothetical protein